MTQNNRFSKPVAFNRTKSEDQRILKYTARRNFSGFAKTAMLEKIERDERAKVERQTNKTLVVEPVEVSIEESTSEYEAPKEVVLSSIERLEQMKQKMKKTDKNVGPKMFYP